MTYFQSTNQALLQMAVEALATAPHFTQAQIKMRTEAVINAIMAFLPTEPVQTMLASQAVGQHFIQLDTFKEIINRALADTMSVRMRTITTQQTKMTLALVKELRIVRKDMFAIAKAEEEARAAASKAHAPAPEAAQAPAEAEQPAAPLPAAPLPGVPRPAAALPAVLQPAVPRPAAPRTAEPRHAAPRPAEPRHAAAGAPIPDYVDDATFAQHMADYKKALADLEATLEEARALDKPSAREAGLVLQAAE